MNIGFVNKIQIDIGFCGREVFKYFNDTVKLAIIYGSIFQWESSRFRQVQENMVAKLKIFLSLWIKSQFYGHVECSSFEWEKYYRR